MSGSGVAVSVVIGIGGSGWMRVGLVGYVGARRSSVSAYPSGGRHRSPYGLESELFAEFRRDLGQLLFSESDSRGLARFDLSNTLSDA